MDDAYFNSAGRRAVIGLSSEISIQIEGGREGPDRLVWPVDWEVFYHSSETDRAKNMFVSLTPLLCLEKHSNSIESKEFLIAEFVDNLWASVRE